MMVNKENLYSLRFILIIFLLVSFDISSKLVANNNLLFGQTVDTLVPLILTIFITLYLLWMIINETHERNRIALSFITGGAIGNVLDRINDGSVTDFLHLKIYNYSLFVFNLADAFITIGAILIIYFEFKNYLK